MVKLTEDMVIARTRQSNLATVSKLNCWGSELVDVSLLRKMVNVEVLSLSVNKIGTLADFQYCVKLQELFVRKNNIKDLNQVCYLKHLTRLKNLWLDENPCAYVEGYRLAVIRCLPNLEKLDNVVVSEEEVQEAMRRGRDLIHPEDVDRAGGSGSPDRRDSIGQAPSRKSSPDVDYYEKQEVNNYSPEPQMHSRGNSHHYSQGGHEHEGSNGIGSQIVTSEVVHVKEEEEYIMTSSNRYNEENSRVSPPTSLPLQASYRPSNYKDDGYLEQRNSRQEYEEVEDSQSRIPSLTRSRTMDGVDTLSGGNMYSYYERSRPVMEKPPSWATKPVPSDHHLQRVRGSMNIQHRPVTRNSNILNAVLCLVKELDYQGLEVADMAIRCRMDELE